MRVHSFGSTAKKSMPVAFGLLLAVGTVALTQNVKLDVVYVPTPPEVVERMLTMANVKSGDFLIDLGSGDGRIPIMAAKKFGAHGFGVDINPVRVKEAQENAKKEGVEDKVEFRVQNLYDTDISKADVLSMYLLTEINLKLRPRIEKLRPGTRVVSHAFDLGAWKPDQEDTVGIRKVFFWVVPARVEGRWRVEAGELNFTLRLDQEFQMVSGSAEIGGRSVPVQDAKLSGPDIRFIVEANGQKRSFTGRVSGDTIEGAGATPWKATKMGG